ncbi:MAG TPA: alpha/beta fold hydrolase [Candidatus Binataceae bacterium]|nr:alpha/beta fold hydrolase [Candidatus Binataceae bacterium]
MAGLDDPPLPTVELTDFLLPGQGLSALLIHGLTGTPYEMRYLGERLAATGIRVHGVKLAGHAGQPEELGATTHENWYESVIAGFEQLRAYGDPIVVAGLSMGALLAARLAIEQPDAIEALVMLSPAFFIPRPAHLLVRLLRPLGREDRLYFRGSDGSDIHDDSARRIHPGSRLIPLRAALNLLELSAYVRPKLRDLTQPALLIHSRLDHVCPFDRNTRFVMKHHDRTRLVALDESFHVITVDSDKDRVAQETIEFVRDYRVAPSARYA